MADKPTHNAWQIRNLRAAAKSVRAGRRSAAHGRMKTGRVSTSGVTAFPIDGNRHLAHGEGESRLRKRTTNRLSKR